MCVQDDRHWILPFSGALREFRYRSLQDNNRIDTKKKVAMASREGDSRPCAGCGLSPCVLKLDYLGGVAIANGPSGANLSYPEIVENEKVFVMKKYCASRDIEYNSCVPMPACVRTHYDDRLETLYWNHDGYSYSEGSCDSCDTYEMLSHCDEDEVHYLNNKSEITVSFRNSDGRPLLRWTEDNKPVLLPLNEIKDPVFVFTEHNTCINGVMGGTLKTITRRLPSSLLDGQKVHATILFASCFARTLARQMVTHKIHHEKAAAHLLETIAVHVVEALQKVDGPTDICSIGQPFPLKSADMIPQAGKYTGVLHKPPYAKCFRDVKTPSFEPEFVDLFEGTCIYGAMVLANFILGEMIALEKCDIWSMAERDPDQANDYISRVDQRMYALFLSFEHTPHFRHDVGKFGNEVIAPIQAHCKRCKEACSFQGV